MKRWVQTFILLLASLVLRTVTAGEFYGTVQVEGANRWVRWSNTPPHVVLQQSTDLTNWVDVMLVSQLGATNGFNRFEHVMSSGTNVLVYRLRAIGPVSPPPP